MTDRELPAREIPLQLELGDPHSRIMPGRAPVRIRGIQGPGVGGLGSAGDGNPQQGGTPGHEIGLGDSQAGDTPGRVRPAIDIEHKAVGEAP